MRIQNQSQYPMEEIRELVEFGMKGVGTTGVAVHVKNCSGAYAGMAYRGVPKISSRSGQTTVRNLITLRIGSPNKFPKNNMVENAVWRDVTVDEHEAAKARGEVWDVRSGVRTKNFVQTHFLQRREVVKHPYGGKRSPLITLNNWREAVVAIAAHEARHVYQFRHNKRASEVDCERFALKRLEAYRLEMLKPEIERWSQHEIQHSPVPASPIG